MAFSRPATAAQLLHNQIPPPETRLRPVSRLDEGQRLNFAIGLPLRNGATLTNLLRDLYDPASARFHRYLTAEEFAAQFGPSKEDYQAVIQFARAHGLTVAETHPNRTLLDVNGTVGDIERALHFQMRVYQHPTEARTFYAPDAEPSFDLAVPILSISGLDDFVLARPMNLKTEANTNAAALATGSGPSGYFIGGDFRAAYAPGVALNGTGQSVGLFELDGYYPSDIAYYESLAKLPSVPLTNIFLDGFGGTPGSENIEVALDIDMSICMAPGLSQVLVYEGTVPNDVLNRMATDNLARQLSSSWSFPINASTELIYMQFAAQGQSMFQASGDSGAYGGTNTLPSPCDDPNLTVVGGTSLTTSGPGGAWASERTWSGSGGGISTSNAIPIWQQSVSMAANHGSTTLRNIPDVACLADVLIWLIANDGSQGAIGGTSAAAPLWAGFAALVNQQAAANGRPAVGFLNPAIYAIGQESGYALAFHDITTGNNTNGGNPTNFFAVPGYDLCTGWGTPAGSNLINALALADSLGITPATNWIISGPVGGPFTPAGLTFVLTNQGTNSLNWTLGGNASWFQALPASGTLAPGGPAATVTLNLGYAAGNLAAGSYTATVFFTNLSDGFTQSRELTLNVAVMPGIAQQPTNQSVPVGETAIFYVAASGSGPLFYQWQWNATNLLDGGNVSGSSTSALTIANVSPANAGNYSVTVSNAFGSAASSNASLTVLSPTAPGVAITTLYSFTGGLDGSSPNGLMQDTNGYFYGTTQTGGSNASGTIFQMSPAGNLTTLYWFNQTSGGYWPAAALAQGTDGSLYGTTRDGGTDGDGTFFKATTNGALTRTVNFSGSGNGSRPSAEMILGTDGNLYGTCQTGGANGSGTIFRIGVTGPLTALASFRFPVGGEPTELLQGADGNFYGTTFEGGANGNGSIFQITTNGTLTNLFSFNYTNGGYLPYGGLVQTPGGTFFGTTYEGGTYGFGTVFQMSLLGGVTTVYSFTGGADGGHPATRLTQANDGNFYGTTAYGGLYGNGTVFRITPGGALVSLVQFNGYDGANPQSTLVQGQDGALYGDTLNGGANGAGTIFRVNINSPTLQISAQPADQEIFSGMNAEFGVSVIGNAPLSYQWMQDGVNLTDGPNVSGSTNRILNLLNVNPNYAGVYTVMVSNATGVVASDYAILSVIVSPPQIITQPASQSSLVGGAAVFSVTVAGDTPLSYQWQLNGANLVNGGPIQGASSSVLTITNLVETNDGTYSVIVSNALASVSSSNALLTVFAASASGTTMAALHSFTGGSDGGIPNGLAAASNGLLYGTTQTGGVYGEGTVFSLSTNGAFTTLGSFDGTNGATPTASLIQGTNGLLYGTTKLGGSNFAGTIFSVTTNGVINSIYSFASNNDSVDPFTSLTADGAGNFYGATEDNAIPSNGNIFEMTPDGIATTLCALPGGLNGTLPAGALTLGTDGNFYGMTTTGGAYGQGNVFKLSPGGLLTNIYSFTGGADGSSPIGKLALGADGYFYGVTKSNILTNDGIAYTFYGSIFKISSGGALTTLYALNSIEGLTDGAIPHAGLIQGSDGNFYGTTFEGFYIDDNGVIFDTAYGTVFRVSPTGAFGTLTEFNDSDDGAYPAASLVEGPDGNLYGTTTSGGPGGQGTIFRISFTSVPQIITQPVNQAVVAGSNATFSVTVFGAPPLFYQWQKNGASLADGGAISGSATRVLTLNNILPANAGTYSVIVSNALGMTASSGAVLTVQVPPPAFQSVAQTNGILTFTWNATPGELYQIQSTASLPSALWNNLGAAITATNSIMSTSDPMLPNTKKFYRIVLLP